MTNREAYLLSKKKVSESNLKISDSEIYRLLMHANHMESYTELIVHFDETIKELDYFSRNLNRIMNGEPIQYVLEEAPFIDLNLYVNKEVLIPRPETEGLMLIVQKLISDNSIAHNTICDVCTGSGCIAIYMKYKYKNSRVIATDFYQDALEVARINSRKTGTDIEFYVGDKFEPLIKNNIKCDVLISNPPYVEKMEDIEPIVKDFEPINAIYSKDGLAFYKYFFKNHKKIMNKNFLMAFEINYDQEPALTQLIGKYFKRKDESFIFLKDIYDLTRYLIIIGGYDVKYFER